MLCIRCEYIPKAHKSQCKWKLVWEKTSIHWLMLAPAVPWGKFRSFKTFFFSLFSTSLWFMGRQMTQESLNFSRMLQFFIAFNVNGSAYSPWLSFFIMCFDVYLQSQVVKKGHKQKTCLLTHRRECESVRVESKYTW